MKEQALLQKALSHIGLTPTEIAIYVAALSIPSATVRQLSEKTGLQRSLLYFHLKSLLQKDVVRIIKKGRSQIVQPVDSEELVNRMEVWTEELKRVSPLLNSLSLVDSSTPKIAVHNFASGHYEYYRELASLPIGSEFRVVQSAQSARSDFASFGKGEWEFLLNQFVERKIATRAIFTSPLLAHAKDHMTAKEYALFKKRIWHIRVPREDYFEVEEMMIHGNVTTFLLTDIGILVRIEHPRIAKAMTALFDALWMTGIPRVFPE